MRGAYRGRLGSEDWGQVFTFGFFQFQVGVALKLQKIGVTEDWGQVFTFGFFQFQVGVALKLEEYYSTFGERRRFARRSSLALLMGAVKMEGDMVMPFRTIAPQCAEKVKSKDLTPNSSTLNLFSIWSSVL